MRRALLLFTLSFAACNTPRNFFSSTSPREEYAAKLRSAGLASSAMARQWTTAGAQALARPFGVTLPYREAGFFPPDAPRAAGLRFTAPRGQKLRIALAVRPDTGARIFAELWRVPASGNGSPTLAKSLEPTADSLTYEVDGEGETFILRLQPELLVAASYTLTITGAPSLGFPVKGGGPKDIGSLWGDPRDAGARRHEGIDIFGKKRTPLVAAADGTVTRVQETAIGGKVVWLRPDNRPVSLYYAHLDEQSVSAGQRVRAGDVIGLMGNTGNARGTVPHLHFGIYAAGGALNPFYFVAGATGAPQAPVGKPTLLDSIVRTEGRASLLQSIGDKTGAALPSGTAVRVVAAAADAYRVVLADGREGWMKVGAVRPLASALRTQKIASPVELLHEPRAGSAVMARVSAGSIARVLAVGQGWMYVAVDGASGWLPASL